MSVEPVLTQRSLAKANRRQALLDAAAHLFAQRGYAGVSIEEIGAAAGISGPAVYRHFTGKRGLLSDLLIGVSEYLLAGAQEVVAHPGTPAAALGSLVDFQVDFSLNNADVIRVQDRELASMSEPDQARVRTLQRAYVQLWVRALTKLQPSTDPADLQVMTHAAFGLMNSTPYSLRTHGGHTAPSQSAGTVLRAMTLAALMPQ